MDEDNVIRIRLTTILLILAIIAIVVMGIFMYKFYNEKVEADKKSTELQAQVDNLNGTVSDLEEKIDSISNTKSNSNNSESTNTQNEEKNYDSYIGTWYNSSTQNAITIKNITNNKITFTWFLYRLAGIDDDTTINFSDGKAIFYYEGYDHMNNSEYIRKATITLEENGVNVRIEDVSSIDDNYTVLDNFGGSDYITEGMYSHPEKSQNGE